MTYSSREPTRGTQTQYARVPRAVNW